MKKILCVLIFVFCLSVVSGTFSVEAKAETDSASKARYLIDYTSGTVLSAKNEDKRLPIASMCKIMTLAVVFDEVREGNLSLEDEIPISENAAGMGGSQVFLEAGATYKAGDLVKSIIISSANDACVAFAEKICGSESLFVDRMNRKAEELGMNNTLFSNCTGLPKPTQYSSAKDVAKMFGELISNEEYFMYSKTWMDEIEHPKGRITGLTNTNKLVRFYEGCDGGKTGYTSEAGHCLTATAKRGGMRLVAVVIGAPDSKSRFKEVSSMLDYGFANFTNKLIVDRETPLDIPVTVRGGERENVEVIPEENFYSFAKKNEKENFRLDFAPKENLRAPVNKGDEVGELIVYKNNEEIGRIACLAFRSVEKKLFFGYVADVMRAWDMRAA